VTETEQRATSFTFSRHHKMHVHARAARGEEDGKLRFCTRERFSIRKQNKSYSS